MPKPITKKCPNCGQVKCTCRPSERAMASAPKHKAKLPEPKSAVEPEGSPLWFTRLICKARGLDVRSDEAGDLLAVAVRMSQADRVRLIRLLGPLVSS